MTLAPIIHVSLSCVSCGTLKRFPVPPEPTLQLPSSGIHGKKPSFLWKLHLLLIPLPFLQCTCQASFWKVSSWSHQVLLTMKKSWKCRMIKLPRQRSQEATVPKKLNHRHAGGPRPQAGACSPNSPENHWGSQATSTSCAGCGSVQIHPLLNI